MQPQRRTVTDRLVDVIQIIQFGNKSGTLNVERDDGSTKEEGYITFAMGRIVEARVGQYRGIVAFNYLATWQRCLFTLTAYNVEPPPLAQLPSPRGNTATNPSIARISTQPHMIVRNGDAAGRYKEGEVRLTVPQRLPHGEESVRFPDRVKLSRVHRRLLMLVDGRRGLDDLARLMVRSPNELQDLLNDLVRGGFIRQ